MKFAKIKKLESFTTASFAIWPLNLQKSKEFHSKIVIIGLNPSRKITFGENFHKKRFDRWYEKGFSKAPFRGAYMTDLISKHEPKSSLIMAKWKKKNFRQKHIDDLESQFKILNITNSTPIFCIGQNTKKLFELAFPNFKHLLAVNHPNSYRMKGKEKSFLKDVKKLGEVLKF